MSLKHPNVPGRVRLARRIWKVVDGEFTAPPKPRPAPSEKELAEGHLTVGVIKAAIEDRPGEVQGPDTLHVSAGVRGDGTLPRVVSCPLSMPGSGRDLVGRSVTFRHTTYDPDYSDDILVTRWPPAVQQALEPVRCEGPGALRASVWSFLAGCGAVIAWAGIALTPLLMCGIIFGGDVFADLPAWFHPGIALAASIVAAPAGVSWWVVCRARWNAAVEPPARTPGQALR